MLSKYRRCIPALMLSFGIPFTWNAMPLDTSLLAPLSN
jgi:hypothetical protein